MPGHTRQVALFGPAAVAIHDERHVAGNAPKIKLGIDFRFFAVKALRNSSGQAHDTFMV